MYKNIFLLKYLNITINQNSKSNQMYYKKILFFKKFYLVYLLKMYGGRKPKILNNRLTLNYFFKLKSAIFQRKDSLISNTTLKENLSKFYFFFQYLIITFLKNQRFKKANDNYLSIFKLKNLTSKHIYTKPRLYVIKNFRKIKEKVSTWFYKKYKKSFFLKHQRNKKIYSLFNMRTVLEIISKELSNAKIIGFSKKSMEFILKNLKKNVENMIIEMSKLSIKRKKTRRITIDWGINNLIHKKLKNNLIRSRYNFQNNIKKIIRKYKNIKKTIEPLLKKENNDISLVKGNVNVNANEDNLFDTENVVFKANKTLMTLLNEILQIRVEELKKATSCLCLYKPSEIKHMLKNEEEKKELAYEKKGIKEELIEPIPLVKVQSIVSKSTLYLSGIDCFLFLKENTIIQNQTLSMSLLSILISDFNFRFGKNFTYLR
jgi:hypothetical protein